MGRELRVSIIGESVLMEGIVLSLENNTQIIVQRIGTEVKDAFHLIAEFNPQVIVYALGHPEIEMRSVTINPRLLEAAELGRHSTWRLPPALRFHQTFVFRKAIGKRFKR